MKIGELGRLEGPVLLFGGPYSNLQATRAMRAEAGLHGIGPENCICTGDVVAYCADAAETVAEIRDWGCHVVAGNCEKQLASGAADCGCGFEAGTACDLLSAGWYGHAAAEIDAGDRAWMAEMPDSITFEQGGCTAVVCHGGFTDIARFLWEVSPEADFVEELGALEARNGTLPDLVVAGHSGIPFARVFDRLRWVNAGVIGMPPHDGERAGRYAVLDRGEVAFHRLEYDWQSAQAAMRTRGLVPGYDVALETGWWPSEDVLPGALRRG